MQVMACSLEKLVENLYEKTSKVKNFKHMAKAFGDKTKLLARKGIYPYEWLDNEDKLNYDGLPPIEEFYSKLYQETARTEDYAYACSVYKELKCKSFKDYHDVYLRTDVVLVADVFAKI